MRTRLLPLALLLALAQPVSATIAPPDDAQRTYVEGRLAFADNELGIAAQRFADAMKLAPDDELRRRAMDVALLRGDMKTVARLASAIDVSGRSPGEAAANSLVVLARLADAASRGDWRAWRAARANFQEPVRSPEVTPVLGPLLDAYAEVAAGRVDAALALVDPATAKGAARSYFTEHQAHILAIAGRWPQAAQAYGDMIAAESANLPRLRIAAAAAALEASRTDPIWRDKAITWLGGGAANDPLLSEARARLAANPQIGARQLGGVPLTATDGLAQAFLRVATDLGRGGGGGAALTFARLATVLAPKAPETWLVTGEILGRGGLYLLALEAFDHIPPKGGWAEMALPRRAAMLKQDGRADEARALLAARAGAPDAQTIDWVRLADFARQSEKYAEAAAAYGRAIALLPEAATNDARAQLHFLRGAAYERSGNWQQAEPDLRGAVSFSPDNPLYLNYLGYSLLDRGGKTDEAAEFIARAYQKEPENGAIIDSMGWLEFRRGNYAEAARLLELAYAAEPADPTVADHLGDALWHAGRRIEARFAWRNASALSPEPELAARLQRKLEFGLERTAAR